MKIDREDFLLITAAVNRAAIDQHLVNANVGQDIRKRSQQQTVVGVPDLDSIVSR